MRIAFLILTLLHGLIHLMGFAKAFGLAELKELKAPVSKSSGMIWLAAALVFVLAGVLFLLKKPMWWLPGLIAVLLSQVLIIAFWKDARIGTLPNILLLVVALVAMGQYFFDRESHRLEKGILQANTAPSSKSIAKEDLHSLPAPVQNWLLKCGVMGKKPSATLSLDQEVQLQMKAGDPWRKGKARQVYGFQAPAFIWTLKLDFLPGITVRGRDTWINGEGNMRIQMLGAIKLVNESPAPKINESALLRYLSEIVWFPEIALSPHISWEAIDENSARASLEWQGTQGSGVFTFTPEGRFLSFEAQRYRELGPDAKRIPWKIKVLEYNSFAGIEVPSYCEVIWELPEGPWTWYKVRITDIQYPSR